jgi:hypothetical protein
MIIPSVILFLLLIILSLPFVLSTTGGKNALVSFLSSRLSAVITIEKLSLSWTGPQKLEGLSFATTNGQVKLSSKEISCKSSLVNLLMSSHEINLLTVESPVLEIHPYVNSTPLQEKPTVQVATLGAIPSIIDFLPLASIPFQGKLQLQNGTLFIFSTQTFPIVFENIFAEISSLKDSSELIASLKATSLQKDIKGSISIDSSCKDLKMENRLIDSKVILKNFPIEGADELVALKDPVYRGVLKEAIGPSLNLDSRILLSKEACKVALLMQSEKIQANLQTTLDHSSISLTEPGTLDLSFSPALLEKCLKDFSSLKPLLSSSEIKLSFALSQLSIPEKEGSFSLKDATFMGTFTIAPYKAFLSDLTMDCNGSFSSSSLSKQAEGKLQIHAKTKEASSELNLVFSAENLLDSSRKWRASLSLGNAPVALFEKCLGDFSLTPWLGSFLSASLIVEGNAEPISIQPTINSSFLQLKGGSFEFQKKTLILKSPLEISYQAPAAALNSLIASEQLSLDKNISLEAKISRLELKDLSKMHSIEIDLNANTSSLWFTKLFALSQYELPPTSFHLQANSFSQISLEMQNALLSFSSTGSFDPKTRQAIWKKPIEISYLLKDQDVGRFYQTSNRPILLEDSKISLRIEPSSIILDPRFLSQTKISASLLADNFLWETRVSKQQMQIQNMKGTALFSGKEDAVSFSLQADFLPPSGKTGLLNCEGSLQHLHAKEPTFKSSLNLQNFPLELIDALKISTMPIAPFIGSPLDIELSFEKSPERQICQVNGKSPLLSIQGELEYNAKGIFLSKAKKPLQIELSLTPDHLFLLTKQPTPSFSLVGKPLLNLSISKLSLPFVSSTDLHKTLLQATLTVNDVVFKQRDSGEEVRLDTAFMSISKLQEDAPLSIALNASATFKEQGSLRAEGKIDHLFNEKGAIDLAHIKSEFVVESQKFPTPLLDLLGPKKAKHQSYTALLGPSLDAVLKTSLQDFSGPIMLQLASQNAKISFIGKSINGILTLDKNASAQFILTPESSKFFLSQVNPLSIKSLSSKIPLSIEIGAKGFSLPLNPFSFNALEVPIGRIQLGKVLCQNEGNLNLMLGLLKAKQAEQSKQLELWFAPLDFHVHQGVLSMERTEVLIANTYDIALWGKVDFPANRVNMILGLTASCLKAAFGIKDLPRDYVLHIPLTGTLDNVDLNKSVATSKIVALTLWQKGTGKAASAAGGSLGGALIGGVLNQVLAPPGNDGPTPAAKTPFPWQNSSKD